MITAQVESFETAIPELTELFPQHWQELALFKDRMPLAPQYDEYVRRERAGTLFLTTVRWSGSIVAYYVAQVAPGFHYRHTLTATQDIVYVVPGQRGQGLILPLMRRVKEELRRRGVGPWYAGYKSHNPLQMDELLSKLGFQPADVYVVKWIGR